jgi:hypothetical protein
VNTPSVKRLLPLVLLALAACQDVRLDPEALTAKASVPVQAPNCASCHAYPPDEINHRYHLYQLTPLRSINGKVTCLDCHSNSLASHVARFPDSIFADPFGTEWSALDYPTDADIRKLPLLRVDTFTTNSPIFAPPRPGAGPVLETHVPVADRPSDRPAFQEYITSLAHMNGSVDVVFHPRVSDTARFQGEVASFDPKMETCSAVACHPGGTGKPVWRFEAPLKGLTQLEGDQ